MSHPLSTQEVTLLRAAFRMPSGMTMVARSSTVTNAFVTSLIPVIEPEPTEIAEALRILGMSPASIHCAYCGDRFSEWDHLRPLVSNRRPTGFISEIANLVPSCGKCNQSKGNKHWHDWMTGKAPQSPAQRGVADLDERIRRLKAFEKWKRVEPVKFEKILGPEEYHNYWRKLDGVMKLMRESQKIADDLKKRIGNAHKSKTQSR